MGRPTAEEQEKWRAKVRGGGVGPSLCVHLTVEEAAILDDLAIELYDEHPHDPHAGQFASYIRPSRAAAIRALIRDRRAKSRKPPRWFAELQRIQDKLAGFWVLETSWRQTTEDVSKAKRRPRPPWLRLLKSAG